MSEEEEHSSLAVIAFILKELLAISPQLCDPGTCIALQQPWGFVEF